MIIIRNLYLRYKALVNYAVFGVLTSVVNIVAYYFFAHILGWEALVSNCLAWVTSCTFAYVTNRIWVFESEVKERKGIIIEITLFFACRLFTLGLETVIMWAFVKKLMLNDMIIKVVANIVVIMANFVLSKIVIFRKK